MICTRKPRRRGGGGSPKTRVAGRESECAGILSPDSAFDPAAVRSWVEGPRLARYLADVLLYRRAAFGPAVRRVKYVRIAAADRARIGYFPIAVLCRPAQPAPDTPAGPGAAMARVVWLSPETAVKQVIHHDDLTVAEYRLLPEVIERGEAFEQHDRRRLVVFHQPEGGRLYRAIVKRTREGERFLTTFHRANHRDRQAIRRQLLNGDG